MKTLISRWMLLLITCALGATGCASPRWQIVEASNRFSSETEKDANYDSKMPILLDSRTGKSWILYPMTTDQKRVDDEDDHGYSWVPVPMK